MPKTNENPNIQRFREAKYGLMLHFGLYSLLGGVYRGKLGPNYAEWTQCFLKIGNAEMERLAKIFCPIYFDADEICAFAKRCGMKYLVVTAKHHEGFALFRSKADGFNVFDASPFHRDIIKELSTACEKHGLKFGVYYSQVIDWHEKHGGGYTCDPSDAAGDSWENSWDFPDKREKNYELCFRKKILPQIEELMTNYGEIFTVWFDMPLDSTRAQSAEIFSLVKRLQPNCLVNSRLGNGCYDFVSLGDNEIPDTLETNVKAGDLNGINGLKPSPFGLYESACTLNRSWGYTATQPRWKSADTVLTTRKKLEKLGVNYLVNIGLDGLGRIPYEAQELLSSVQEKYRADK